MKRSTILGALSWMSLMPLACGGGTPAASGPDKAITRDPATAGSASSSTASSAGELLSPAPSASGSAGGDDVWLAYHQISQKDLLAIVRGAEGRVQNCFRAGLKRDRSLSGETKIKFVVSHEGAVRAWKDDDSSMSDEDVTKCIGEVINSLNFKTQRSPGDAWGIYTVKYGL